MNIGKFPEFQNNIIMKNNGISSKKPSAENNEVRKTPCDEKAPQGAGAFGIIIKPAKVNSVQKEEPSQAEKLSFLLKSEVTPDYAEKISKLTGAEWRRAEECVKRGNIPDAYIETAAKIEDEDVSECVNELIDIGFNEAHILSSAQRPEFFFKYGEYTDLYNKGYDTGIIHEIAGQKANQLKNTDRIINLMKSKPDYVSSNLQGISCFCDADENVMQRAEELINMDIKDLFAIHDIVTSDETTYKRDIALLKRGYKAPGLHRVTDLKGKRAEKADKLIRKHNMINYHAALYSNADDNIFSRIDEIKEIDKQKKIKDNIYSYILALDEENYSTFKKLIDEGYDFDTYFDEGVMNNDILKNKISELSEDSKKNERIWKNFLYNSSNAEKYKTELSKDDVFFLKHNAFDNKYYTPEEYTDAFVYLKNLKTDKGSTILECEEFYDKKPDDEKLQNYRTPLFYNNIKQILSISPGSVDASYIQTCLELIKEGAIHPAAIRKLSPDNSLKLKENGLTENDNYSIRLSDEIKSDIDVLYSAIYNNEGKTKEEIDKLITDNYVTTYSNNEEACKNAKIGDVYNLENENFVRIKTAENEQMPLKITKETYTKLFPPYERFASSQQLLGDCYCLETLMNLYSDKDSRAYLLKLFEEDDKGNISVKLKDYPPVLFENGEFPTFENEKNYSSGAKGFKLLEYAYSEALVQDEINSALSKLRDDEKQEFRNFITEHPHNFFIYDKDEKPQIMTFQEAVKTGVYKRTGNTYKPNAESYDSFNALLAGNGGLEYNLLKTIGLQPEVYYTGSNKNMATVSRKSFEESTAKKGVDIDRLHRKIDLNGFLNTPGLFENNRVITGINAHSYGLNKAEDGGFYIYNPHNQAFPVKVKDLTRMKQKGMITSVTLIPKTETNKTTA